MLPLAYPSAWGAVLTDKLLLDAPDIARALARVAHEILERNHGAGSLVLVGVRTRGVPLAERLQKAIGVYENQTVAVGALDVAAYRDDLPHDGGHRHGEVAAIANVWSGEGSAGEDVTNLVAAGDRTLPAAAGGNCLAVAVADMDVVLVDDVLYTGRTIRAAMDALVHLGRPRSIQLAVLVDRGHRELPIRPDYVGKNIPSARSEIVQVRLRETDGIDAVSIVDQVAVAGGCE
ncbi:MAG: bifunctional pyr operon transcriptional regulator/uracil phosphoribosyltransferase PyrR [Chloroflexi bacterium]|nr:bifunctional pyr operon transcriptional regulator/uracil phosphoribosyltransferase PyrR [Chloroflexota bacterium]